MALFRGILVLGVLLYLASVSGTLTVLLLLVALVGAVSVIGRPSLPAKKPASIVASTGTLRPKLWRVK